MSVTHCTSQKLCFFKFCVNIIQLSVQTVFTAVFTQHLHLFAICYGGVCECRQLCGAQPESDRGRNNRMFAACGNTARDDHQQAATVATTTGKEKQKQFQQIHLLQPHCFVYSRLCG